MARLLAVCHSPLYGTASLSLALKVGTCSEEGHALVHDCLADPEVVVDPLLDAGCFGELFGLYTRTVSASRLAWVFVWWVVGARWRGRT